MVNVHAAIGGKTKSMGYYRITMMVVVLFSLGLSMVGTASVAASPTSNSQIGTGQELQEVGQGQQQRLQICGSNMTEGTNATNAINATTTTATGIPSANNNATISFYENPAYGIQILCPENWVSLEEVNPVTGDIQVYFTPLAEVEQPQTTDETPPTVSVATMQLPTANLGVPLFADLNIEDLTSSGHEIVSSSLNSTLSGMPAWEVVYVDANRTMFLQDWTIQGDRAYAVMYISHESRFNQFLPIAQDMISSFTIIANDTSNTVTTMEELPPMMNTTTPTTNPTTAVDDTNTIALPEQE
jgi:hypothetical protein